MKVLLIEDEPDFVDRLKRIASERDHVDLMTQADLNADFSVREDNDLALEEQLAEHLKGLVQKNDIDLILLDTDLSRNSKLRSQTEYRYALVEIGVPTLRYRKRGDRGTAEVLKFVHRLAVDGATAIKVPDELVRGNGPEDFLFPWIEQIHSGFKALEDALRNNPEYLRDGGGPAGVLSRILNRPDVYADLVGYTAPNAYFFGTVDVSTSAAAGGRVKFATQIGYWLLNYILAFPGPILPPAAAAAVLNITRESFDREDVQRIVEPARYEGPFSGLFDGFYWRQDLIDILMQESGDITDFISDESEPLERVEGGEFGQAYYCLVNNRPIASQDASIPPDWIPAGATVSRINQEVLDQLGPMLNI